MKLFVVSDIHSYYDEMMSELNKNGFDINNKDHWVVICGDLFDRGRQTRECFEFAKSMAEQKRLLYICGNHEDLLFDCVNQISDKKVVSKHHVANGTLTTIADFTGMNIYDLYCGTFDHKEFLEKIMPLVEFISDETMNFAEIGEYIFVHGWVPCDKQWKIIPKWDTDGAAWFDARWINGMDAWNRGARLEGKTIVCGHWHCSWGHSHLHQDRKEFPQKNRIDWEKSFEPFVDKGIIAIDACTAWSGFVNCLVLDA
jgi:hypothetical protein